MWVPANAPWSCHLGIVTVWARNPESSEVQSLWFAICKAHLGAGQQGGSAVGMRLELPDVPDSC